MTTTQYITLWVIYLLGALFFIRFLRYLSNEWNSTLRNVFLITIFCLLFIPWLTKDQLSYLSPAFFTAIYDAFIGDWSDFYRAGLIVLTGTTLGVVITILFTSKK